MASTTRKSRNYKERRSMLAFGHFVLPLAAIVALGLLFVGIKLFFLTPNDRGGVEVTPTQTVAGTEQIGSSTETTPADETGEAGAPLIAEGGGSTDISTPGATTEGTSSTLLAGPIGPGSSSSGGSSTPGVRTNEQATQPSSGASTQGTRPSGGQTPPSTGSRSRVSANARWGVQIGAFQKAEGAETLIKEVTKQGYTASVSTAKNSSGTTFHRVRVAAGNTRDDAARLAVELEKKGYPVLVIQN